MSVVGDATETQKRNIEMTTGRSIDEWVALARSSGNERHSDILAWLKAEHGFSHGNANLVALLAKRSPGVAGEADPVAAMYAGAKTAVRPLHDHVIAQVLAFGPDVELAPKQAYVSLRRAKQFGTVGPGPKGMLEIGINLSGREATSRLQAGGGMCTHRVRIASVDECDAELIGWLREAYERA
jgi:predicted transport protein